MNDLISRQAAIAHFKKRLMETAINNVGVKENADRVYSEMADYRVDIWMNEIPSAQPKIKCIANITMTDEQVQEVFEKVKVDILATQPERKKGMFIGTEFDGYADGNPAYYEWICSECGCTFEDEEPTYNFCPNCGCEMER